MSEVVAKDPDIAKMLGVPYAPRESAIAGDAYDGASRKSRELMLWNPPSRSADSDMLPAKPLLDARSKDAIRNDAYVSSGSDLHKDNIVGSMFLLNSKPGHEILGLDETWAEEYQKEIETKFTLYAESPQNWIDASRLNTLTGLTRMAVAGLVAPGEVLASVEWLRDVRRPYRTAIQMIDVDRLSNPMGVQDSDTLRAGVVRDFFGAPQGYHVRMAHPTDYHSSRAFKWRYVPARKPWGRPQMIHIYDQIRPDQSRGITAMVAALKELRITKKFRDIVLQNAVVNATFAASIESDMPPEAVFAALGAGSNKNAIADYAGNWLGAIADYTGGSKNLQIDGVKIPHLFPGTKLKLQPAGQGGPLGTDFEDSLLRYLAANLGVSYEQLSKNYSKSSYSALRAAAAETWKYMQARKRMGADRFASLIFRCWLEEAFNTGEITSLPKNAPNFYEGLNAEAYTACEWIGASRGQIDELKETQAAVLRVRNNLSTREYELARLGMDYRKVFAQLEREKKEMEARGIQVDMGDDNMMNAATGEPRDKKAKNEKRDGSEDNTDV